jgi:hypothetical protein
VRSLPSPALRPSGLDLIDSELERALIGEIVRGLGGEPVENRTQIDLSGCAMTRSKVGAQRVLDNLIAALEGGCENSTVGRLAAVADPPQTAASLWRSRRLG